MSSRIECAFTAVLMKDAQVRTAKTGRQWLSMLAIVGDGDEAQVLSVASFSASTVEIAANLTKGVSAYIEGAIRMRHWDTPEGPRSGLQVSATLVQPKGLIGHRKPKAPARGKKAKVDPQAPLETARPFDDALPF